MTDEITPELFEHLVELAALEITPEEADYLQRELNNQLKAIHELEAIPFSDDTEIASHGVLYTPGISPPIRADEWIPCENSETILDQAPEMEDGYFVVPEIPHEVLE